LAELPILLALHLRELLSTLTARFRGSFHEGITQHTPGKGLRATWTLLLLQGLFTFTSIFRARIDPLKLSFTMSSFTVPLLLNGKEVTTSTTFPVISPSTGEALWSSSSASKQDALEAVAAAEAAFPAWAKTKPNYRRDLLLRAADLFAKRTSEAHEYIQKETGAVEAFSSFNTSNTLEIFRDVAGRIISALQGEVPICQEEGTSALILKEPYGVVLGIAPW
jgi:delta 1-pyrroline-5-carboxylate dehydrogenase